MARTSRKLNSKATIITIAFVVFAAAIAGGLIFFAMTFGNVQQEKYDIAAGSTVYDIYDSPVIMSENSYILKAWTGSYSAKSENNTGTDIGDNTIAVDNNKIVIIGGGFRIYEDGSAIQLTDFYETTISDYQFYKLADRKYLFVAPSIIDKNETIATTGYAYIVMDKQGNAKIMNNDMYSKTLIPTIVQSGDFTFDIANELFYVDTLEIDMKDIIGTTNEYNPLLYVDANSDYDGYNFVNPETIEIEIHGGDGGTGGIGGQGGRGGTGGTGGNGSNAEQSDIVKDIGLLGIEKTATSINIRYHATDPFAQFGLIYLAVYDNNVDLTQTKNLNNYLDGKHMYGVNVYNTSLGVYGLKPNHTYQVVIGHIVDDEWYKDDAMLVTTSSVTNNISIVSQTADTLKLSVKFDSYYDFYKFAKIDTYYYAPNSTDASCKLNRGLLNATSTSFSVSKATASGGVIVEIPYDVSIAQKSETLEFEVSLNSADDFAADTGITEKLAVRNGYYDGTICGATYFVTVENGFGEVISKTSYKSGANFKFTNDINPKTAFLDTQYNNGWGLKFEGWVVVNDKEAKTYKYNETYKVEKDETVKAVWGCSIANTHLGNHQCVPDDGYMIDPDDNTKVIVKPTE